jgi:serine phosphatase RsbU (regulator of sigma subunit)
MTVPYSVIISILYLACGVFIFLLGLTILRIGQSSAPTRAAALMLFFAGIGPLLTASGIILESTIRPGSVVYLNPVQNFEYLWEFYFPSLLLFALNFPRENRVIRSLPFVGFLLYFPYIFHLTVMMFGDRMLEFVTHLYRVFPTDREVSVGSRDVAVGGVDNVLRALVSILEKVHRNLFSIVNIIYSFVAIYLLSRNLGLVPNPRLARQLRTIVAGLSISIIAYVVTKFFSWTYPKAIPEGVVLALTNSSLVISGGTIAFAVIKQQFLGIRYVMRRSLLYSAAGILFAATYIIVVRPVSEFFGQYSAVSQEAFETGFIILAIMAFQPTLVRMEEVLGKLLLKGRADTARRFRALASDVSAVTSVEELETVLQKGFRDILDSSAVALRLCDDRIGAGRLAALLESIGEPIRSHDLANFEEMDDRQKNRGLRRRIVPLRQGKTSLLDTIVEGAPEFKSYEVISPIVKEGRCVAYVGLAEKIYGVPYGSEELAQLSGLTPQIASALQNIQLLKDNVERQVFEEELKIARKIQTQLLPGDPPRLSGFDLSGMTVPSRYVGGDYYDYVLTDGGNLAIVVADVSGKGIPASILTASLQAAVRSNEDVQDRPALMMARLNNLMYENTSASEFATLFYGVVDMDTGEFTYSNAGHDFPILIDGDGARSLEESGIVLGCLEEFDYQSNRCVIPPDGTLAIYTDGLTESESASGEYFGADRLRGVLVSHAHGTAYEICRNVIEEVKRFGSSETLDDLTLVVLKHCRS